MSSSYDLFCRWKHVKRIQSDNAGAIALGVTRATVSTWKQGKNAEIHYVEKMATEIGDSPEVWAAQVMAERANSDDERSAWARIAQKLAGVATLLLVGVLGSLPAPAQAATAGFEADSMCIMRNAGWTRYLGRLLRDWLAHRLHRPKPSPENVEAFAWI